MFFSQLRYTLVQNVYICIMISDKKLTYEEPRAAAHDLQFNLSVLTASPTGESYDGQVQYDDDFDD